ncbi:hypothetical protein FRX31_007713 [Thalictrum thalictroides]|uniref:Uncharacterized protein n=1 Tax=Thalictrum thalictroides TaxID=46969 RepID=A0A7J6X2Y6_THATH|nr:hypothetical protein FRX31_007713 [Thalictrum thalictroides]
MYTGSTVRYLHTNLYQIISWNYWKHFNKLNINTVGISSYDCRIKPTNTNILQIHDLAAPTTSKLRQELYIYWYTRRLGREGEREGRGVNSRASRTFGCPGLLSLSSICQTF